MKKKEFHMVFQLSKTILFEVEYYTLGDNPSPHFSTSAEQFTRSKLDFDCCGRCQPRLLVGYPEAMAFFKKWDVHHLKDLSDEAYSEMVTDLAPLCAKYNYLLKEHTKTTPVGGYYFENLKDFSMNKLKTANTQTRKNDSSSEASNRLNQLNRPIAPFFDIHLN